MIRRNETITTPVIIKMTIGSPHIPRYEEIPTMEAKNPEKRPLITDRIIPKTEIAEDVKPSTKISSAERAIPLNQLEAAPMVWE